MTKVRSYQTYTSPVVVVVLLNGFVRRTTTLDNVSAKFMFTTIVIAAKAGACIRPLGFALWGRSLSKDEVMNALKKPAQPMVANVAAH